MPESGCTQRMSSPLAREIVKDRRQQRIEIFGGRLGKGDDAEAVADRRGQGIEAVGGGDVGDLRKVKIGFKQRENPGHCCAGQHLSVAKDGSHTATGD